MHITYTVHKYTVYIILYEYNVCTVYTHLTIALIFHIEAFIRPHVQDAHVIIRTNIFVNFNLQSSGCSLSTVLCTLRVYLQRIGSCVSRRVIQFFSNAVERHYTILVPLQCAVVVARCSFDNVFFTRRAVRRTAGFACQHSAIILLNVNKTCKNIRESDALFNPLHTLK